MGNKFEAHKNVAREHGSWTVTLFVYWV